MSAELKQYSILDKSLQVLVLATENGKVSSHAIIIVIIIEMVTNTKKRGWMTDVPLT